MPLSERIRTDPTIVYMVAHRFGDIRIRISVAGSKQSIKPISLHVMQIIKMKIQKLS